MTDLCAGGEDTSFTATGTCSMTNGVNTYRTGFARAALQTNASTSDPPANRWTSRAWTAGSTIWFHGQCGNNNSNSWTANNTFMRLLDGSGVARIVVRTTGTNGQLKIDQRNAAGVFTNLVTSAAGAMAAETAPQAFDLFVNYSTTGQATLYIGGVVIADTGPGINVTTDSATSLAQCDISSPATADVFWSEIIVRNSSTLGAALFTLPPVAAGNTQSWTPNTVGNIDEWPINDSSGISTSSDNAISEWTVSTTLPSGDWAISSVVQEARVSCGLSGPQHFEFIVRTSDGSDHVDGYAAPTTSLENWSYMWTTNPHTSNPWNAGELINAGIESLA